jgi:hypothetical protein
MQAGDGDQVHPHRLVEEAARVVGGGVLVVGTVFVPSIQRGRLIRPDGLERLKPPLDFGIALPHLVGVRVIEGQGLLERKHMRWLIMSRQGLGDLLGAARAAWGTKPGQLNRIALPGDNRTDDGELRWRALTRCTWTPRVSRISSTGIQDTPIDSMATVSIRQACNQAANV